MAVVWIGGNAAACTEIKKSQEIFYAVSHKVVIED